MRLYAIATRPHYLAHMAPILDACASDVAAVWTDPAAIPPHLPTDGLYLVASFLDATRAAVRACALLEHGAGQSYPGDPAAALSGSYSGGDGLDHVRLFLAPNATVAERWRGRYPSAAVAVVGCPKLDSFVNDPPREQVGPGTVAFTWHWDCRLCPESRWAWPHYQHALPAIVAALRADGHTVIGHHHPRIRNGRDRWAQIPGVVYEPDLDAVMAVADVLVGDNTSALPEFAATGRPVVWLNAPWYRRAVHHGGRFWQWPHPAVTADEPAGVLPAIRTALHEPADVREHREAMVDEVYAHRGNATARAVAALREVLHGENPDEADRDPRSPL